MTDTDFDPWDTVVTNLTTKVRVSTRLFNKSLVDRAQKRIHDVARMSGRKFVVLGNDQFRDTYPQYDVTWNDGDNYDCSCYALNHGESRARSACSHVVAVMLYREANGFVAENVIADGRNGDTNRQLVLVPEEDTNDDSGGMGGFVPDDQPSPGGRLSVTVPSISDNMWTEWDQTPLPAKFQELRPHQWDAMEEAWECYARGVELVYLDAPTGSGKSLIAELLRRRMQRRAFYICHSKTLQAQFLNDFPYAKLLMGRSNYPTLDGGLDTTCADCTATDPESECHWCDNKAMCPYQVAKSQAIMSKLAIVNTAYFLTEFNYVGQVGQQRELGIIDECDTLESELMGFVEFYLGERILNRIGVTPPKEGSHYSTLAKWLIEEFKPRLYDYGRTIRGDDLANIRARMNYTRLMTDVLRIEAQVARDETMSNWVRDNGQRGAFVLKPVTVGDYGDKNVWVHAKKWLCMSATIISADELSNSCGLNGGDGEGEQGRRWEVVTVPMTFPKENRPIIVVPVADMSKKGKDAGEWQHAVTALRNVCDRHPNDRILVHTVSYELARYVMANITHTSTRPIYTYTEAGSRDLTLSRFRRDKNSVLVAPSMDRGVDLADDDCRVVVVMKMPFPYLGDPQVSKRMHLPGGNQWYTVQTVRKLVQMCGRAVRHENDTCTTYVFDRQFTSNLWRKNRGLFPKWWSEALVMDFPMRELLR